MWRKLILVAGLTQVAVFRILALDLTKQMWFQLVKCPFLTNIHSLLIEVARFVKETLCEDHWRILSGADGVLTFCFLWVEIMTLLVVFIVLVYSDYFVITILKPITLPYQISTSVLLIKIVNCFQRPWGSSSSVHTTSRLISIGTNFMLFK